MITVLYLSDIIACFTRVCSALILGSRGELYRVIFDKTFSESKNARCLDGSPAGFFWHKGEEVNKWTIHIEGTTIMCLCVSGVCIHV